VPPASIPSRPTNSRLAHRPDPPSAEPESLFTYGTLQVPDVLRTLLGRVPARTPAILTGWQVVALPHRVYPGLVPAGDGDHVAGQLLTDLTPAEWLLIDAYEDPDYDLRPVTVRDAPPTSAYVWRDLSTATRQPWSLTGFIDSDLPSYLDHCRNWRDRDNGTPTR
jgi:hypothetical protein